MDINETDNVYGVNRVGKIIWKIENLLSSLGANESTQGYNYLRDSIYVHIHLEEDDTFIANTFASVRCRFDCRTGKLIKPKVSRW